MDKVSTKRLKYFGHVLRMKPTRYPEIAVEGNVTGNRPRGRPPKRWLDCILEDCKARSIIRLTEMHQDWLQTEKPGIPSP